MTAPLVDQTLRRPLTDNGMEFLASIRRDGDLTTKNGQIVRPGQLWEREAERDVQAHGEPAPATISARLPRGRFAWNHRPGEVRALVAEQIECRRPAMRARHA